MPYIKIDNFSGIVPRTGPTQLEANQAQVANNIRITSKELSSWKEKTKVFQCTTPGVRSVYKLYNNLTGDYRWLEWATDVDVIQGPVADLTESRIYYTGDGAPKKTNWNLATTSGTGTAPFPDSWLYMGVPNPVGAPTLAVSQPLKQIEVTNGGQDYTSAPSVTFSSGAATATAKLNAGIKTTNISNAGSGYYSAPVVTLSGGNGTGGVITAKVSNDAGTVATLTLLNGGSGYTSAPAVTITGGGGSGAIAEATIVSGVVTTLTIINVGSGYTSTPTVTFSGGGGSGATATATVATSGITELIISNPGEGYETPPTLSFSGGGGSGAAGTVGISGFVESITLNTAGTYTAVAPTVTISGGGGTGATAVASFSPAEERAYIYTYVSTFGSVKEESGPSPATNVTVATTGATVTVSGFSAAPTTGYNITHRRIYRTLVGATSVNYVFVAEIPIATSSYVDTLTATQLGESLSTLTFEPPPNDLTGLVAMANGMVAGFRSNEVWFAEPYLPHAWPSSYMITVDSEIVGLGVYDTSLVVLTKNRPYILTGTTPAAMSQVKLPLAQPCVSKRSIASDQYGVIYASPNGLVSIGTGTQDIVTLPLYTRDDWQQLNPASMLSTVWNNLYIGFCQQGAKISAIVIARNDIPPLFILDFDANAVFVDRSNSDLFGVSNFDNAIYQLDSDIVNFTFYEWLSKRFIMPAPLNFAALKIKADFGEIGNTEAYNALVAQITAQNQALFASASGNLQSTVNGNVVNTTLVNGSILQPIPSPATARSVNVIVYGDGEIIWAGGVTSQDAIRLPAGKKYYQFEVRLSGNIPVQLFAMATDITELRMIA